jgi:DNA-binding CsgD family transcriptional regulator
VFYIQKMPTHLRKVGRPVISLDDEGSATTILTARQAQCLRGVLELKSAKEIARDLGISPHAVEKHLRICREKFGVATSAEAARYFARQSRGNEFPHYDISDLVSGSHTRDGGPVLEQPATPNLAALEETYGALSDDHPLTPLQTLLAIAAVSFVSIVGLLLLVACAEGIRRLVTN